MSATLAIRLDFRRVLLDDASTTRRVSEVLSQPAFAALERVSARRKNRWVAHAERSADVIERTLLDPANDSAYFDTNRGSELVASGEIENGLRGRTPPSAATALMATLVLPLPDRVGDVLDGVLSLAAALETGAGFVSTEPDYGLAHRLALGGARPKERPGLSELRQLGRRGRQWKGELRDTQIATVEWGTFLGAGHLARIDLASVRGSGAFARVIEVSPSLAFLQVTADPLDDLSGELESRLPAAREALAPLLMDISDVNLD